MILRTGNSDSITIQMYLGIEWNREAIVIVKNDWTCNLKMQPEWKMIPLPQVLGSKIDLKWYYFYENLLSWLSELYQISHLIPYKRNIHSGSTHVIKHIEVRFSDIWLTWIAVKMFCMSFWWQYLFL